MSAEQSVIVCEGYHDRAFFAGWLKYKGCRVIDWKKEKDPFGSKVDGGHYGFMSPVGSFIRVVPAHGDLTKLVQTTEFYLRNAPTKPTRAIVVATDADDHAIDARRDNVFQALDRLVTHLALPDCERVDDDLRAGPTLLRPLVWPGQPVAGGPGIPSAATLEQLVCAVLARHEPHRTTCVHTFLATAGDGAGWKRPADIGKSHAWAWMAHRRPIDECERFFEAPWEDATLAAELEAAMGAPTVRLIDELLT